MVEEIAVDQLIDLVTKAKDGDRAAFGELVRATYEDTYSLAYRLTADEDDACDVLQEAYLRAFKAIKRFRGDAAFSTWLYRITANCASTYLSRKARIRHEELDDDSAVADAGLDSDPEAIASATVDRSRVNEAVMALPVKLRSVLVLRDIYDLPHEAIASELGISETAAKVRLHRARKKLREVLFMEDDRSKAHAV